MFRKNGLSRLRGNGTGLGASTSNLVIALSNVNAAKVRCRSRVDPEDVPRDVVLSSSLDEAAHGGKPEEESSGKVLGSVAAVGGLCILIAGGFLFKDQIRAFLLHFTGVVDEMGAVGWVLYALVYAGLEVLAVPAIPLTMASGAIFGIGPGSVLVSFSGTIAATISFLIARYVARDRVCFRAPRFVQPATGLAIYLLHDSCMSGCDERFATCQESKCLALQFRIP